MDANDFYGMNGMDNNAGTNVQSGISRAGGTFAQTGIDINSGNYAQSGTNMISGDYAQSRADTNSGNYARTGMNADLGVFVQTGMNTDSVDYVQSRMDNERVAYADAGQNYGESGLDVIGINNNRKAYYDKEPYVEAGHYVDTYVEAGQYEDAYREPGQYGDAYGEAGQYEGAYGETGQYEDAYEGEESYDEAADDEDDLYYKRKEIIEVARYLYDIGLIVRTWGNVSARVDKSHFLITPSGIRYEDLTPEMIPLVRIKDQSYQGDYIPSSESKVHAACYKTRPECTFIVHTHQVFASCAGALGMKKIATYFDDEEFIIPVVPYGYPGTEKLADNVAHTLKRFKDVNALIMANHGTVCLGQSSREAVYEAQRMEIACNDFLIDVCNMNMTHGVEVGFNSHLEGEKIVYDIPDTPERVKSIHEQIYSVRPDVKYIIHNKSEAVTLVSRRANHMRPLLDDFAQLIGTSVNIPKNESELYHNIRKTVNVVFSPNDGAYCFGPTEDDAQAVALVLDKGCIAYTAVLRNGEGHYVPTLECILMNRNYRKNYSKLADKVETSNISRAEETEDSRYEQYDADAEYADEFDVYEEDNADFLSDESLQQYEKERIQAQYAQGLSQQQYAEGLTDQEYAQGLSQQQYAEGLTDQEYAQGLSQKQYAEGMTDQEYAQGLSQQQYAEGMSDQQYVQGLSQQQYAEGVTDEQYAQGLSQQQYTEGVTDQQYAPEQSQQYAEGMSDQQYAQALQEHQYSREMSAASYDGLKGE